MGVWVCVYHLPVLISRTQWSCCLSMTAPLLARSLSPPEGHKREPDFILFLLSLSLFLALFLVIITITISIFSIFFLFFFWYLFTRSIATLPLDCGGDRNAMAIVFLSYIFFKYFCDFLERFVALGLDSIVKQSSSSRKKKKKPQKLKEEQTSVSNGKDEEAILFFYLFHFFLPHFFPSRHADAQFPEIGH